MKEIIFVMPGMNGGGAERVIAQLASFLCRQNKWKVTILLTEDETCVYPLEKEIEVIYIGSYMPNPFEQIDFIHKQIKQRPEAIVVSFLDNQNIFTAIALQGLGKHHFIVSERNDPSQVKRFRRFLKNFFYRFADDIVFQTEDAKAFYPVYLREKGSIIMNPLKNDLPVCDYGTTAQEKRFVAFSRLTSQKNIPMMLRAFQKFHKKHPDYCLDIYGKGGEEEKLKELTRELELTEWVHFMGFQQSIHNEILNAVAFLSSSNYEGMSNAMIEAMAIGLPVICTDCPVGGAKMVIRDGVNGILVPVNDAERMCRAMEKIVEEPEYAKRISMNGLELRDRLSIEKIVNEWLKVLVN